MALAPAHLNKSNHGHMLFVSILLETKIRLFNFYKIKLQSLEIHNLICMVIKIYRWVEFHMT